MWWCGRVATLSLCANTHAPPSLHTHPSPIPHTQPHPINQNRTMWAWRCMTAQDQIAAKKDVKENMPKKKRGRPAGATDKVTMSIHG